MTSNHDNTDNNWLSITEAAKAVGYHRQTVYNLVADGSVESRTRSYGYEVNMTSLREYIAASELRGPQPKRKNKEG